MTALFEFLTMLLGLGWFADLMASLFNIGA